MRTDAGLESELRERVLGKVETVNDFKLQEEECVLGLVGHVEVARKGFVRKKDVCVRVTQVLSWQGFGCEVMTILNVGAEYTHLVIVHSFIPYILMEHLAQH